MFEECERCDAACCRYQFQTLKIEGIPHNKLQYEYWSFMSVDSWEEDGYIVWKLNRDCPHLDQETNRCKDYEDRPQICRDYPEGRLFKKKTYAHICERMRNNSLKPTSNVGGFKIIKEKQHGTF